MASRLRGCIQIQRVGIIGGGLAGLCCAYELRKAGVAPIIFEKEESCGGRIRNVTIGSNQVPIGAIMFTPEYSELVSLVKELGFEEEIERVPLAASALLLDGKPLRLNPLSIIKSGSISVKVKLEIRKISKLLARLEPWSYPKDLMKETLSQYLERKVSEETIELIIKPALNAFFQDSDQVAAGVGLQFLKSISKVHVLSNGNATITQALSRFLEESVLLRTEVNAVIEIKGRWRVQAATSWREVDSLVCATPLSKARRLFPQANILPLPYAQADVLVVKGKYRYNEFKILIDGDWKDSGIHSIKNFGPFQVIHSRTSSLKLDRFYDSFEIIASKHWKEALPIIEPGVEFQRVETNLPRLYLCGDFYLGGRMESAVRSAKAAARAILVNRS
ncbi:MAG TPA: FAD-dependent oxidoreductase [Terriglobales bacterium]|nr:FAD-dependent oxidoreductase [Terriglobales bacterium]